MDAEVRDEIKGLTITEDLTEKQRTALKTYRDCHSLAKTAKILGVSVSAIEERFESIRKKTGVQSNRDLLQGSKKVLHSPVSPAKSATARELEQLIAAQEYRCALSGVLLEPETASIDHKVPFSRGGDDSAENLQWVDWKVNRMKGTLSNDEFIQICRQIAAWNS